MRYLQYLSKLEIFIRHGYAFIVLTMALLFVSGCNNSNDEMQTQLDRLQQAIDSQINALNELGDSHQELQLKVNEYSGIRFDVSDIKYELVEKAFEPLLLGDAKLSIVGDKKPELIFVEWSLTLTLKGETLMAASFIQRVENGEAELHFTQSLPRHNIKKNELSIKVEPTAWYMGHVAHVE